MPTEYTYRVDWQEKAARQEQQEVAQKLARRPKCGVYRKPGSDTYCQLHHGHDGKHWGCDVEGASTYWR